MMMMMKRMCQMQVLLHDFGRICSLSLYLSLSPLSSRSPNFFSFVHFDFECFHFFLSSSLQSSIAMLSALCSLSISLKLAAFILTSSTKSLILISFHFIYLYVFRSCYFSLYDCLFLPLIISLSLSHPCNKLPKLNISTEFRHKPFICSVFRYIFIYFRFTPFIGSTSLFSHLANFLMGFHDNRSC